MTKWPENVKGSNCEKQDNEPKRENVYEDKKAGKDSEPLRCEAMCTTTPWRSMANEFGAYPCNNMAAVLFPNGMALCAKHAGKHLLAQAVKRRVIKCVNTVPNKQPTATKDITLL